MHEGSPSGRARGRRGTHKLVKWLITVAAIATIVGTSVNLVGGLQPPKPRPLPPGNWVIVDEKLVSVPADEYWADTGIKVKQGDLLDFEAEGRWWSGISATGPDGDRGVFGIARPASAQCPVVDANLGALIGMIAGDSPFKIGSRAEVVVAKGGSLSLAMNDNASAENGEEGSFYRDNKGYLRVKVTLRRIR